MPQRSYTADEVDAAVARLTEPGRLKHAQEEYAGALAFTSINPKADEVYRILLELCRQSGIAVLGLIVMPESSDFRRWYGPGAPEVSDRYLTQLAGKYGTHYVNAREWLDDHCFADGHHTVPGGARAFTDRFWREIVEPWAEKR